MKNTIKLIILALLIISCTEKTKYPIDDQPMSGYMLDEDKYTELVGKFMKAYRDNNMEDAKDIFTEDATYAVNSTEMSVAEFMAAFSTGHDYFDNISHNDVYTATMYYNDGKIFTNIWYNWSGVVKNTGETLNEMGYAWFRWEDGKVVQAYNAFDPTAYNAAVIAQMETE